MTPSYDFNDLLSLEPDDLSLPRLAADIRLLVRLRTSARVAMAVRLALAHKLITSGQSNVTSFTDWCRRNVLRIDGQPYSIHSINRLVRIGQARNPAKALAEAREKDMRRMREVRAEQKENVVSITAAKVLAAAPKTLASASGDVSQEVNALMTAWEHAEDQARRQFLHLIGVAIARRA